MGVSNLESDMVRSSTKRKKLDVFGHTEGRKYFHLQSTRLTPFYPQLPDAFKLAADMILDAHEAAKVGPHNDHLLYPVLYLYRHCLELKLKDLVRLGVTCGDFKFSEVKGMLGGHHLQPLWSKVALLFSNHCPKDGELREVRKTVLNFDRIDEDGNTLRYDRSRDQKRRRYEQLPTHITIANLRETMAEAYRRLDTAHAGILDCWDAGQDCE
jgi:hypothetical protein